MLDDQLLTTPPDGITSYEIDALTGKPTGRPMELLKIERIYLLQARSEEARAKIAAAGVYSLMIVFYIKHFDDAGGPDIAFGYTGIETVTPQIVQTIHIQLTADQLVQEFLRITVSKNVECQRQAALEMTVQIFHQQARQVFVVHIHQRMFKCMRKRTVAYIMQ